MTESAARSNLHDHGPFVVVQGLEISVAVASLQYVDQLGIVQSLCSALPPRHGGECPLHRLEVLLTADGAVRFVVHFGVEHGKVRSIGNVPVFPAVNALSALFGVLRLVAVTVTAAVRRSESARRRLLVRSKVVVLLRSGGLVLVDAVRRALGVCISMEFRAVIPLRLSFEFEPVFVCRD